MLDVQHFPSNLMTTAAQGASTCSEQHQEQTRGLTCSRSCLQQVLPLLRCSRLLQLRPQHERPAHDKLMPGVTELLLLGLLQQGLQVPLQHLVQQLVHMLRGQVLL